jgi:hypothetical protein
VCHAASLGLNRLVGYHGPLVTEPIDVVVEDIEVQVSKDVFRRFFRKKQGYD